MPCLALLVPVACGDAIEGDGLPPGAFTSGPEDDGFIIGDDSTTTGATSTDPTDPPSDGSSTGPTEFFHDEHILPLWENHCAEAGCHVASDPQAGLDLETAGVYDRLCNSFHALSGVPYIDCTTADPQNSYLFRKLEGTHLDVAGAIGGPMPPDGQMTDAEIGRVEAWILQGAPQ